MDPICETQGIESTISSNAEPIHPPDPDPLRQALSGPTHMVTKVSHRKYDCGENILTVLQVMSECHCMVDAG